MRRGLMGLATSILIIAATACGGNGADSPGPAGDAPADPGAGNVSGSGEGDGSAFRLGQAGWENACVVLSQDEVADVTGFTVIGATEMGGCGWAIEHVDENIVEGADSSIGWLPMQSWTFDIQNESALLADSSITIEMVEGIGESAFWQGVEGSAHGEMWVQVDQLSFRVVNQFATFAYEGDIRTPMEALARALADSLSDIDVVAASGESGAGLVRPTSIEVPEGFQQANGPMAELAGLPAPDDAVFLQGFVSDRASQDILTAMSVGDATRFFLEALPGAGFEVVAGARTVASHDDVLEYAGNLIEFVDPSGQRGEMRIELGPFSPTAISVQVFLD